MKTVKAKELYDEPVTDNVRKLAVVEGHKRHSSALQAKTVRYVPEFEALAISFADQAAVLLPVKKYAELAHLSLTDLQRIEVGFGGNALCLDERDLHVSIAGMVSASKPLMQLATTVIATQNGRRTSAVKTEAARENGKKGGRPRKLVPAE